MPRRYRAQIPNAQPASTYFGPTLASLNLTNAGAIPPSATPTQNGFPLNIPRGAALVTASMSLDNAGATLAAGDTVTFQIFRDGSHIGATSVAVAATAGGSVNAYVSLTLVDFTTPGAHTYSAHAAINNGHTAEVPPNQAAVAVVPL